MNYKWVLMAIGTCGRMKRPKVIAEYDTWELADEARRARPNEICFILKRYISS